MNDWPFDDPENVAVLTVRQVVSGERPIRLVARDADDGMWQFLTGDPITMADALIVGLGEVFRIDPSIGEVAELELGASAERECVGRPWRRSPCDSST